MAIVDFVRSLVSTRFAASDAKATMATKGTASKDFVRRSVAALEAELEKLGPAAPADPGADPLRKDKRAFLLAEVGELLRAASPPESPVLAMFGDAVKEPPPEPGRPDSALGLAPLVLRRIGRWNENRSDFGALNGLAEDVDRIVSQKIFKLLPVRICLGAAAAALLFAVWGVVRFQDKEFDAVAIIESKRQETVAAQERAASAAITDVKTRAAQASADAENAIKEVNKRIQARADEEVRGMGAARQEAVDALKTVKSTALSTIAEAADVKPLSTAVLNASATIANAASQAVNEAKAKVAPAFDEAIRNDAKRLDALEQQLRVSESRMSLVQALLRRVGTDDRLVSHLAAHFDEAVVTVYGVLAVALCLVVANAALLTKVLWRRFGR
jgi:hypothetical protein